MVRQSAHTGSLRFFFFQAEDGIRDWSVTGVQTCALPISPGCDAVIPLRRAGERLRSTDLAAFSAAGIARILVREPRIRVLPVRGSGIISAAEIGRASCRERG